VARPSTAELPLLTERALNRALLARQGLLDGYRGPVPRVLERVGFIQAQYAPAMYVGLLARMRSLRRGDVTAALERRTAIQATLLRSTIHLVSREDYWPTVLAIREHRRAWYARATGSSAERERAQGLIRGVLPLILDDGRASCAYLYPLRVNGERADYADPLANDQDWALVFALRLLGTRALWPPATLNV